MESFFKGKRKYRKIKKQINLFIEEGNFFYIIKYKKGAESTDFDDFCFDPEVMKEIKAIIEGNKHFKYAGPIYRRIMIFFASLPDDEIYDYESIGRRIDPDLSGIYLKNLLKLAMDAKRGDISYFMDEKYGDPEIPGKLNKYFPDIRKVDDEHFIVTNNPVYNCFSEVQKLCIYLYFYSAFDPQTAIKISCSKFSSNVINEALDKGLISTSRDKDKIYLLRERMYLFAEIRTEIGWLIYSGKSIEEMIKRISTY
ncbi:MAG: hypothetical protein ACTSQP_22755 [Promethearchaeota archaeon]